MPKSLFYPSSLGNGRYVTAVKTYVNISKIGKPDHSFKMYSYLRIPKCIHISEFPPSGHFWFCGGSVVVLSHPSKYVPKVPPETQLRTSCHVNIKYTKYMFW